MALVSLFREQVVDSDVGITGEISLSGSALAIGGLKEKLAVLEREEKERTEKLEKLRLEEKGLDKELPSLTGKLEKESVTFI